jgi:hypothetical protein
VILTQVQSPVGLGQIAEELPGPVQLLLLCLPRLCMMALI